MVKYGYLRVRIKTYARSNISSTAYLLPMRVTADHAMKQSNRNIIMLIILLLHNVGHELFRDENNLIILCKTVSAFIQSYLAL